MNNWIDWLNIGVVLLLSIIFFTIDEKLVKIVSLFLIFIIYLLKFLSGFNTKHMDFSTMTHGIVAAFLLFSCFSLLFIYTNSPSLAVFSYSAPFVIIILFSLFASLWGILKTKTWFNLLINYIMVFSLITTFCALFYVGTDSFFFGFTLKELNVGEILLISSGLSYGYSVPNLALSYEAQIISIIQVVTMYLLNLFTIPYAINILSDQPKG